MTLSGSDSQRLYALLLVPNAAMEAEESSTRALNSTFIPRKGNALILFDVSVFV